MLKHRALGIVIYIMNTWLKLPYLTCNMHLYLSFGACQKWYINASESFHDKSASFITRSINDPSQLMATSALPEFLCGVVQYIPHFYKQFYFYSQLCSWKNIIVSSLWMEQEKILLVEHCFQEVIIWVVWKMGSNIN